MIWEKRRREGIPNIGDRVGNNLKGAFPFTQLFFVVIFLLD